MQVSARHNFHPSTSTTSLHFPRATKLRDKVRESLDLQAHHVHNKLHCPAFNTAQKPRWKTTQERVGIVAIYCKLYYCLLFT